jgi:hypothetical protein
VNGACIIGSRHSANQALIGSLHPTGELYGESEIQSNSRDVNASSVGVVRHYDPSSSISAILSMP